METVPAGVKVVVEGLASAPRVLPFLIAAVELVVELDFLRDGKAQSRVADFDIAAVRREPYESAERIVFPISMHLLDIYRRGNDVLPQTAGVDRLQNRIICEPQTSVGGFRNSRLKGAGPGTAPSKTSRPRNLIVRFGCCHHCLSSESGMPINPHEE